MSRNKQLEDLLNLNFLQPQPELPPIPMAMPAPPPPAPELPPVPMALTKPEVKRSPAAVPTVSKPRVMDAPEEQVSVSDEDSSSKVRDYLKKKYGLEEAQAEADDQRFLANMGSVGNQIGAAIAGTKLDNSFYDRMRADAGQRVQDIKDRRKDAMDEIQMETATTDLASKKATRDPNSKESIAFRKMLQGNFPHIAKMYGKDFDLIAAGDRENIMQPLVLKEQIEGRKQTAAILASQREEAKSEKREKDIRDRDTQFGIARTADDAKKLKEASELKTKLNSQIKELIAIRKAKGAEVLERDVVARAKQLSKDLLLTKKNLENLGVLSQSDRDIVDEIIPSDPTQFNFSQVYGQDPTLTKLENFQRDTEEDFNNKLRTRLEDPSGVPAPRSGQFPREVRKGDKTATVSNEAELKEAQSEGWQ